MKIKFLTSVAGINFAYRFGEIADLRPDIAKSFVKTGQAERYTDPQPEAAVLRAPEQSTAPRQKAGILGRFR